MYQLGRSEDFERDISNAASPILMKIEKDTQIYMLFLMNLNSERAPEVEPEVLLKFMLLSF